MNIKNKSINTNKNRCKLCSGGIMSNRSLFCYKCHKEISEINIYDLQYDLYKIKIKTVLLNKYDLLL